MKIDQDSCENAFTCVNCAIELCWRHYTSLFNL